MPLIEASFSPVEHIPGRKDTLLRQLGKNGATPSAIHQGAEILRQHHGDYGVRRTNIFVITDLRKISPPNLENNLVHTGRALAYLTITRSVPFMAENLFHPVTIIDEASLQKIQRKIPGRHVFGIADIYNQYPPHVMIGAVDITTRTYILMASPDPLAKTLCEVTEFI